MAVVQDSFLATFSRTGFIKPPDLQRELSAMPRAIVNYSVIQGTVSAKPVNDQQELTVALVFQTTFAYRYAELHAAVLQDVAFDWTNRAYLEIVNGIRNIAGGSVQRHPYILEDIPIMPGAGESWTARVAAEANSPRYVIQTLPGSQAAPVVTFKCGNQAAAVGAAGTLDFFASFFEYDIEQVERFPIHWPVTTWAR